MDIQFPVDIVLSKVQKEKIGEEMKGEKRGAVFNSNKCFHSHVNKSLS